MLKKYSKLKKLCMRNGKIDGRKMKSKAFIEELSKITLKDLSRCPHCKTPFIPDNTSLNFITKKWDKHTWKPNCDCYPKDIRIHIG